MVSIFSTRVDSGDDGKGGAQR